MEYRSVNNELIIVNTPEKTRDEKGRFIKGLVPWNTGRKGVRYSPATEFKKGNKPHNTRENGTIKDRLDKRTGRVYKYIKINNEIRLYHRYLWELSNGKIPARHVIIFIDGNNHNCSIENLECISMRENVRRNQNYEKFSVTMKTLWKQEKIRERYGLKRNTKLRVK